MQDLREITGRWHTEQAERIQALNGQIQDVKRRNSKLYEVLEELGRDTPNLGDLTRRLRDNNATIKKLEEQRITLEAEQPPQVEIADEDLTELAEVLTTTLKRGYNPGKTRALFADFIKRIVIEGASMRIEYDPHRLVGVLPPTACRVVPSRGNWLPSPTSPGTATLTRLIPAAVLPRRAKARRYG